MNATAAALPWPPGHHEKPTIQELAARAAQASAGSGTKPSGRWAGVLAGLSELEDEFINLDPTGSYSDRDYLRARAFVVLAHAQIESYVEGMALEVADAALKGFERDAKPRTALLALAAYAGAFAVPDAFKGGPWGLRQLLKDARQVLWAWSGSNNGVKQKDVLRLLLPVGLKESDMGAVWLGLMDDLGEMRGIVAHNGFNVGSRTAVDPGDAATLVSEVIRTISRVDVRLCELRDE